MTTIETTRPKPFMSRHRRALVPAAVFLSLALVALIFGRQLWTWFSLEPLGGARSESAVVQGESLQIEASIEPDPPRQRGNVVHLSIADPSGQPLRGTKVSVEYDMPAMGQMAEMRGGADVSSEGAGRYRAAFDLPMAGSWTLIVTVQDRGATTTARYGFTVGSKGLIPEQSGEGATRPAPSPPSPVPARQQAAAGVMTIDEGRRQQIGVKTGTVKRGELSLEVRAIGKVTYDERGLHDVSLKYKGWIEHLSVNATGQRVRKGQVLFTIYSPELYAAEGEYLLALASARRDSASAAAGGADALGQAARQKLLLWDLTPGQLDRLARSETPQKYVAVLAPASGYVIEKNVVEGAAVDPGQRLYRIAGLDPIWVEAEVYEPDLPHIRVGQTAKVSLSDVPGQVFAGKVAYVYPYLDAASRTGKVRVVLRNPSLALKPDMYADVTLEANLGKRLMVPASSIIYTGPRRIVFLDLGGGRLRPVEVVTGAESGGEVEILAGLEEGDRIVTSGNFLVAAESRIRSALELWQGGGDDHGK